MDVSFAHHPPGGVDDEAAVGHAADLHARHGLREGDARDGHGGGGGADGHGLRAVHAVVGEDPRQDLGLGGWGGGSGLCGNLLVGRRLPASRLRARDSAPRTWVSHVHASVSMGRSGRSISRDTKISRSDAFLYTDKDGWGEVRCLEQQIGDNEPRPNPPHTTHTHAPARPAWCRTRSSCPRRRSAPCSRSARG